MKIIKLLTGLINLVNFLIKRNKVEQYENNVEQINNDPVAAFDDKFGRVRDDATSTNNDLHSDTPDVGLSDDGKRD